MALISEEPAVSIFKAEGEERKFIRNLENYPKNYTTSYPILTTLRTLKLTKQQIDTVQLNEESKEGEKEGTADREKEGKPSCAQKSIIL